MQVGLLVVAAARSVGVVAVESVHSFFTSVVNTFIISPLSALYFRGPTFNGYGFWGGAAPETICASLLPGSHASFWAQHMDECHVLLSQRFDAFQIAAQTCFYVFFMLKLVQCVTFHCLVVQPALGRMEQLLLRKNVSPTTWNDMPTTHVTTSGAIKAQVAAGPIMFSTKQQTAPSTMYCTAQSTECG